MSVVADTGPLIALTRIGHLHLLGLQFDRVLIPAAVAHELSRGEPRVAADWLDATEVVDHAHVAALRARLGPGESAAIALAHERTLTLLIDERRGRAMATSLGITVTGTVGVLVAAKAGRHVAAVQPLLAALIASGVHISPRVYAAALVLAGGPEPIAPS
jgi:predicted nucleic acid-binding protein